MSNIRAKEDIQESIRIYSTMVREATMVKESFPRMIADVDRDIAVLNERRARLFARHTNADNTIAEYSGKIDGANAALEAMDAPAARSSRRESPHAKIARKRRELAALERDVEKESRRDHHDGVYAAVKGGDV